MIEIILYSFAFTYVLWVGYLAAMCLVRNRDRLSMPAKVLGYPYALMFVIADAVYNATVGSLIFLEPPYWHRKEFLMTTRLKRHLRKGRGWRFKVARFYCHQLLDTFDPSGEHC